MHHLIHQAKQKLAKEVQQTPSNLVAIYHLRRLKKIEQWEQTRGPQGRDWNRLNSFFRK